MNTLSVEDKTFIQRVFQSLRAGTYCGPKSAWAAVSAIATLDASKAKWAANLCRARYGHRPCARVGLKTKPFYTAKPKKTELTRAGRVLTGYKKISLKVY